MCITGMGRELIKLAAKIATEHTGGEVVYIDTDAIFVAAEEHPDADLLNELIHNSDTVFNGKTNLVFDSDVKKDFYEYFYCPPNKAKCYVYANRDYEISECPDVVNDHPEVITNYMADDDDNRIIFYKSFPLQKVDPTIRKDIDMFTAVLLKHGVCAAMKFRNRALRQRIEQLKSGELSFGHVLRPSKIKYANSAVATYAREHFGITSEYEVMIPILTPKKTPKSRSYVPESKLTSEHQVDYFRVFEESYGKRCMLKLVSDDMNDDQELVGRNIQAVQKISD
jgi:hypothetical protein